ncbi:hypothetical protein CHARACLAT_007711 [Characodon lateralis]|uniref:Bcl-2-like protein 15 n=1 Tax=Characodon lateralis TaxID=208331 RepID=A0ABU7DSE3_9TELE|nr:hypothetical protein [Characodon lateralis]
MAPNQVSVESQTKLVIYYLLADENEIESRMLNASNVECDGIGKTDHSADYKNDSFDPVLIADKLRSVADAMSDDAMLRAALADLKQAAADEVLDAAFCQCVETLCKSHASKGAEVAPEMQLIRASVAFGLYVKKISPDLKDKVQGALTNFLNRHVGTWVSKQGGWDKVPVSG